MVLYNLINRPHYVRLPGGLCIYINSVECVAQGTVLGSQLFFIIISDIYKCITSYKLFCFVDNTRVYSNITQDDGCDNFQSHLRTIYSRTVQNNVFFTSQQFHYFSYSASLSSNNYNVCANTNMDIIKPLNNVLNLHVL